MLITNLCMSTLGAMEGYLLDGGVFRDSTMCAALESNSLNIPSQEPLSLVLYKHGRSCSSSISSGLYPQSSDKPLATEG